MSALLVCALAAALQSSQSLLIRSSRVDGELPYSLITVTVLSEALKCLVCLIAVWWQRPAYTPGVSRTRAWMFYAPPGLLYAFDNNIVYVILTYLDPSTLSVVWNVKIAFSYLLLRAIGRRFSSLQRMAIVLLLTGVATAESQALEPCAGEAAAERRERRLELVGFVLALGGAFVSSSAGVYTEWVLKREIDTRNFFAQNLRLYVWGVLFNAAALLLLERDAVFALGFFHGYTWRTWATATVAALGGLCSGSIFKYLGNVPSLYAHVASMMLTTLISAAFLGFDVTLTFACGFVVSVVSLQLYYSREATPPAALEDTEYKRVPTSDGSVSGEGGEGGEGGEVEMGGM